MDIILDPARMEACIPPDKVRRAQTSLNLFERRKSCTLNKLQSFIGTLNFDCQVVPPGRPFFQRMIELTRRVSQPHHLITSSSVWQDFISSWNGASFYLSTTWVNSDSLPLHTDASGSLGFRGIFVSGGFMVVGELTSNSGNLV